MQLLNNYTHHDTKESKHFQLSLPMNVDYLIGADESVRTLIEITERLDYQKLNDSYKRLPQSDQASPKQMFQLVILGFMLGIYSTRKLESACRHDIRFIYLLHSKPAPDHNRFFRFIQLRLQGEVLEHLFYQLVHYLKETGEISFSDLFVDGTKIEANANRYTFVWKKSTTKYEQKLEIKLQDFKQQLLIRYPFLIQEESPLEEDLTVLKGYALEKNIPFVSGRGKRKSQVQRDIEALTDDLARRRKYRAYQQTLQGRNSFSKTDPDATFMRMKEDHMRNGQLKPAYNLQLGVEGEYIVGVDVSSERSDTLTLLPLLDRMESHLSDRYAHLIADAGYDSEENLQGLLDRQQVAYIKPQNYERSKTRKYKNNAYLRENMAYDEKEDAYTCPNGDLLTYLYTYDRKSKSGYTSEMTVYEGQGCGNCPLKSDCTRAKGNRQLHVSKKGIKLRQMAYDRITSEEGKEHRMNRSIQVEGAFGVLKQDDGFRRFLRRGTSGVMTEVLLYAFAFNVNKKHHKKKREIEGVIRHKIKVS